MSLPTPPPPLPSALSGLLRPEAYAHPVGEIEVITTNLSWVVLAGDRAYKIRRPVRLPFVDFRALADRERDCEAELALNRRFSPGLYLGVSPITGDGATARLGGTGAASDYALVMHRFDRAQELDRLVRARAVTPEELARFAVRIAHQHAQAPRLAPTPAAFVERTLLAADRNAHECAALSAPLGTRPRIEALGAALHEALTRAGRTLARRARTDHVRDCHGDLHLGNIVRVNGQLQAFDGLEFDPSMRHLDVAHDLAFLLMDLRSQGAHALAATALNAYLQATGDYRACRLLAPYMADRALVRAKVMALAARGTHEAARCALARTRHRQYLDTAEQALAPTARCCLMLSGLPGSGKSTLASALIPALGAIVIRSDTERKRLAGLPAQARTGSAPGAGLYDERHTICTYRRLRVAAAEVLAGGGLVVLDANFGQRVERARLRRLCQRLGAALWVVECQAPPALLSARVRVRLGKADASEADESVLERQRLRREALRADEGLRVLPVDSVRPVAELTQLLATALGQGLARDRAPDS